MNAHNVVDVETRVTIVEREEAVHGELSAEVVVFATKHLLAHACADLGLEIENRAETEVTAFSTLIVLRVLNASTTTESVHTGVNVFVEVKTLLSLGHTTASVHVDGIEEIRLVGQQGLHDL